MQNCPDSTEHGEVVRNETSGDEVVLARGVDVEHRLLFQDAKAFHGRVASISPQHFVPRPDSCHLFPATLREEAVMASGGQHLSALELNAEDKRHASLSLARDHPGHELAAVIRQNHLSLLELADFHRA